MYKKLLFISILILIISSSTQIKGNISNEIIIELGPYPQNTKLNSTIIIWQTNICP